MEDTIKFLCNCVEACQAKGSFSLKDAYVLKECTDFLLTGKSSNDQINKENSLDGVFQALNISQTKGCFSLTEAHKIYETIENLQKSLSVEKAMTEKNTENEAKITEL